MLYKKSSSVKGNWIKKEELINGSKAVLVSEAMPSESNFFNKDGSSQMQDVAKIKIEGQAEISNVKINKPTLNALIEAFGEESENWVDKILTVHTEKMIVAGKRVTALYLIPEGMELGEDEGGYLVITKIKENEENAGEIPIVEDEDIKVKDIPF